MHGWQKIKNEFEPEMKYTPTGNVLNKFSPGQNAGSEQSLFGLASNIATFFSDSDQGISDCLVPENSETQIALQQEPTFNKK